MLTVYLKVDGEEDFIISHQEFSLISADENIWSSLVCLCSLPTTYHVDVDAQTLRMGTGFSGGLSSITGEYNGPTSFLRGLRVTHPSIPGPDTVPCTL